MIAQDLTKFTLVLVILGIVLAIAIFRPQVFGSPPIESTEEPESGGLADVQFNPGPEQSEEATLSHEDLLAKEQELDQREAVLEGQLASLQAQEEHLASQIGLMNEKEDAIAESLAAIQAGEEVVPASELKRLNAKVRELERILGKKTMENEILKDAVKLAHEKKLISRMPLLPEEDMP